MKGLKRIIDSFKKLRTRDKVMAAAACVLTAAVLVSVPTLAWFTHQKKLAAMAKINSPAKLSIRSGAKEDIIQFKMSGIDTTQGTSKDFVFCVEGEEISNYKLQIVHTTNIAFEYNVYKAVSSNDTTDVPYEKEDRTFQYYKKDGEPIEGVYINPSADAPSERNIGNDEYADPSYNGGDVRQKFAEPLYWQTMDAINARDAEYNEEEGSGFLNYYVLEVSWKDGEVENDKETDLIYITAQVASDDT